MSNPLVAGAGETGCLLRVEGETQLSRGHFVEGGASPPLRLLLRLRRRRSPRRARGERERERWLLVAMETGLFAVVSAPRPSPPAVLFGSNFAAGGKPVKGREGFSGSGAEPAGREGTSLADSEGAAVGRWTRA